MSQAFGNERLRVVLEPPGAVYTGSRFDWTTQVVQVTLDGVSFLTKEKTTAEPNQGWGLAGEFGIATPVGFDDCPVGELFPKVGVGLLRRPDDAEYQFHRGYEVTPARFTVRPEGAGVLVTATQDAHRGYGWRLKRHWQVSGTTLRLESTLANTGSRALVTEEYLHNFVGFDGPVGPSWSLELSSPLADHPDSWVNPENLMERTPGGLGWKGRPTQEFFLAQGAPAPSSWTLVHPTGRITETVDRPVARFHLWGKGHVVSPELYLAVNAAPGAVLSWTRTWSFSL